MKFQPRELHRIPPDLTKEIARRQIPTGLAKEYLQQGKVLGRNVLLFPNDAEGFETYRRDNKRGDEEWSHIGQKAITTFRGKGTALVFEHFWDFLSYHVLRGIGLKECVITNGLTSDAGNHLLGRQDEIDTILYFRHDDVNEAALGAIVEPYFTYGTLERMHEGFPTLSDFVAAGKRLKSAEPPVYHEPVINRAVTPKFKI